MAQSILVRENYAEQLHLEKAAVSREVAKLKHSG